MSLFRTLVFYITDLWRDERLNVGVAMAYPETGFLAAKFLPKREVSKLERVLFGKSSVLIDAGYLQSWADLAKNHKEPLDPKEPFTAIYGKAHYMSCFQWRSASFGILAGRTPEQIFEEMYTLYVERKVAL